MQVDSFVDARPRIKQQKAIRVPSMLELKLEGIELEPCGCLRRDSVAVVVLTERFEEDGERLDA